MLYFRPRQTQINRDIVKKAFFTVLSVILSEKSQIHDLKFFSINREIVNKTKLSFLVIFYCSQRNFE